MSDSMAATIRAHLKRPTLTILESPPELAPDDASAPLRDFAAPPSVRSRVDEAAPTVRAALRHVRTAAAAMGIAADNAWTPIEIVAHTITVAAITRAQAFGRAAARSARRAPRSLGFDQARPPRAAAWRGLPPRQFRLFFVGSVISNWGTWLQNTAQVLIAYKFTHSVLTVGLVTCVQFSTPLLLGPWASVVADRIGARRTLIGTQVISAAVTSVVAILQFTHYLSETDLFISAFVIGLMFTFALPAQSALIPALVPENSADSKAA